MPRPRRNRTSVVWPPPPPPDKTEAERETRIAEERKAKLVSDTIDATINAEKDQRKRKSGAKVLLLGMPFIPIGLYTFFLDCCIAGQAESGKSTILKNFQIHFSPKAFRAEVGKDSSALIVKLSEIRKQAEEWRPVIHLNLVRSVNFILNVLNQRPNSPTPSSSSLSPSPPNALIDELRHLSIRLAPLRSVEQSLAMLISGGSPPPAQASGGYNPARASEISVRSGSALKSFLQLISRNNVPARSHKEKTEDLQNRRILSACAEDIVTLWGQEDLLRTRGIDLREQAGL